MRFGSLLAAALIAAALAPIALAPHAAAEPAPTTVYLIYLTDQRSHDASLAMRAVYEPEIRAVAAQRNALIHSLADLGNPVVLELSGTVDRLTGEMRVAIAAEATRLHAYSRFVAESYIEELGGAVLYRSPFLNLDVIRLPPERVELLRHHPLVASVEPDAVLDLQLDISVPTIGASSFWGGGYTGGPFELVVPDTGVDPLHPGLIGKVSDARTFHDQAQSQGDYNDNPLTTDDLHGHGTHIAGIVAGQDSIYRGVAYGMLGVINAKFGYLTNTGNGRGTESDSMKAMDWAIFTAGGDVLSLSFGGGSNDDGNSGWGRYMDALVDDLGIPVSVAAGNSGPGTGTLGQPATSYNILTVGATDDQNTASRADDTIAGFSSRGPTGDMRLKPDIAAPGSAILSAAHDWETAPDYVSFWGTSMAAPHVGAGLLLFQHATGAPAFPARSKAVFLQNAQDMGAAGPDTAWGWGSLDLFQAWTYRNMVIEGNAAVGTPAFYRISGTNGDRVTMVWQKHVVYNGINYPNTWLPLNNLDLSLYDEAGGSRIAQSTRTRDNVEQVNFPSVTTGIAKVFVVGLLNVPQEPFALAAKVLPTFVSPPSLSAVVEGPTQVDSGQNFVVFANVSNPGGLRLFTSTVTLNLPPGVTLVSGANPASLGGILPGTTRSATWTLTSSAVGTHTITAGATGSAYEETYVASGGPIQVTVRDVTPPTILNHGPAPSPQNVGGLVNVSAAIADNVAVTGAWIRVVDPYGVDLGNVSMSLDPVTLRYYMVRPYPTLGRHDYFLWTRDAAGNWGSASGAFLIADLESPSLTSVAATPNPQEVHFNVNVTATATDNVDVWVSHLFVLDPLGSSTNVTMSRAGSAIYLDRPYDLVGTHTFRISVRDAAFNWATATGSFQVRDTTAPIADAGPDRTVEAGTAVLLDATASTDNVGIVFYTWSLFDGGPWTYFTATVAHPFNNVGSFVVTLTVRDAAGNSDTDVVTISVVDPRPPDITDVRADPSPQDVGGSVSVSAVVYDQFGLAGVWLRVTDPGGSSFNVSMSFSGGRYASARTYSIKGLHLFEIWASDTNGNWAPARGGFEIVDRIAPAVAAAATPSPQDIFAPVSLTATVSDNDAVTGVTAEVRDPSGGIVATLAMVLVGGEWRASYVPAVLGVHYVTVWAADPSGNLGQASASFLSVDREPPTIDVTVPTTAEVLSGVDFTATIEDNLGMFLATLEVRSPSGASLGNRTLFGPSPFTLSQRMDTLGPFTWTVYAVDPSGNAASVSGAIQVVDTQPPIADAGPDRTIIQGTSVPLDGSGSSDNFGIESFIWTFVANSAPQVLSGKRMTFAFRQAGTYAVRLIVTDLAGNSGEDTATITVAPADSDADGLTDDLEVAEGTDPHLPDTDGDGILDGSDPDPLSGDLVRFLATWPIVLVLSLTFLVLLAMIFRRRRKEGEPVKPPRPRAPPPPPTFPLPPPPTD